MRSSAPVWVRVLLAAERAAQAAARVVTVLRDEALFAWLPPARRPAVNAALYAGQTSTYGPGGRFFSNGLFDWERAIIEHARFPRAGTILVGGAGGGRETSALLARGYSVIAFEPTPELVRAGARLVAGSKGSSFHEAAYADVVRASSGGGPLAAVLAGAHVDGVVLGWDSFVYLEPDERDPLFAALRHVAPRAPVLVSFRAPPPAEAAGTSTRRLRLWLRRLFAALGAPAVRRAGEMFSTTGGFLHGITAEELRLIAERHGYRVAHLAPTPSPHALLVPAAGAGREGTPDPNHP